MVELPQVHKIILKTQMQTIKVRMISHKMLLILMECGKPKKRKEMKMGMIMILILLKTNCFNQLIICKIKAGLNNNSSNSFLARAIQMLIIIITTI